MKIRKSTKPKSKKSKGKPILKKITQKGYSPIFTNAQDAIRWLNKQ